MFLACSESQPCKNKVFMGKTLHFLIGKEIEWYSRKVKLEREFQETIHATCDRPFISLHI